VQPTAAYIYHTGVGERFKPSYFEKLGI